MGGRVLEHRQALDRFLASVERRAFRMAEFATRNRDDALDVVQDAMLSLVKSYADRAEQDWPRLFQRILQSRIRDCYRRSRVRNRFRVWRQRGQGEEIGALPDPIQQAPDRRSTGPLQSVMQRDAIERLQQALQALPFRQQQVFLLRTWEGLDVAQTAFAMGCSEGSVKTHYSRAVHRLREMLEAYRP